ncbi:hypothetical protein MBLNU459_g4111t1 [Dothideomycetes sp. NU459]
MPTILISGAANGLGSSFVQAYARDTSNKIIAVDKDAVSHPCGGHAGNVSSHTLDITMPHMIESLAKILSGVPIDLFIHSIGVRGLVAAVEITQPDNVAAAETFDIMNLDTLMRTFHINAAGSFMLIRALLPNLRLASDAKVVIMSSRMGSVGYNTTGSAYAYRASKAALNAMIKSFSIDVPEICFVMCHPGRVETKLVKCKEEGAISADESVKGLLPLIQRWSKEDSGKLYDRFGDPIQW